MTIRWLKIKQNSDGTNDIHQLEKWEQGAFPSATIEENPTAEEHKMNCKEFGLIALMMLEGMTQEEILADSRTEAAFNYAYTPDINPSDFGIICLETYQDICDGKLTIH